MAVCRTRAEAEDTEERHVAPDMPPVLTLTVRAGRVRGLPHHGRLSDARGGGGHRGAPARLQGQDARLVRHHQRRPGHCRCQVGLPRLHIFMITLLLYGFGNSAQDHQ